MRRSPFSTSIPDEEGVGIGLPKCDHFHETLLVNSETLYKLGLEMSVEARKKPAYALDETRSKRMEFGAWRINQQSLMWPTPVSARMPPLVPHTWFTGSIALACPCSNRRLLGEIVEGLCAMGLQDQRGKPIHVRLKELPP